MSTTNFILPAESSGSQPPSSNSRRKSMAGFSIERPTADLAVVGATGDIDASNSADLATFAALEIARCQTLIVDLSAVKYFAADGYSALNAINEKCVAANKAWVVVPNRDLTRLLRICDVAGELPISVSLQSAVEATADRRAGASTP